MARALQSPTREFAIIRRPTVGATRQARLPTGTPTGLRTSVPACWRPFTFWTQEGHFGAPADRITRRDLMTKSTTTSLLSRRAFLAGTTATVATLAAAKALFPSGA